ncbi:MAG TPA: hypothetical protein VND91_00820 [Candidatus Saccharimonadia bacterium]|nr:hypothetical protein [Candidatus Saccharimonadia bacterium]
MIPAGTSAASETADVFVTPKLFDRIVASERNIIAIETPRVDELLAQFRHFALRSGNSIYAWSEADGLQSLREGDVSVPGSARLQDALRYVGASLHFGVYVFRGVTAMLRFSPVRAQVLALLRQIARSKPGVATVRKLVLIEDKVALSDGLDEITERFVDEPSERRRYRLRDGRWVQ